MKDYEPNERYLGYHLEYYFNLLEERKGIEDDFIQIKDSQKRLEEKLKRFPLEIPELKIGTIPEIVAKIDSQLDEISKVISSKWENISITSHSFFSVPVNDRNSIKYYYRGFPVKYSLKLRDNEKLMDGASRLIDRLNLKAKNINFSIGGSYIFEKEITAYFNSIDQAVETTKQYLLLQSE